MPRLDGVDLARAVAILGMFIMHTWRHSLPDITWLNIFEGRATLLFCVLAGVSVTFITRRRSVPQSLIQLIIRGILLTAIGLLISTENVGPIVILTTYGAFFALVAPLVFRLSLRLLGVLTVITAVAAPAVSFLLRQQVAPPPFFGATPDLPLLREGEWLAALQYLFLTGAFPLLTFIPFFLGGMALGQVIVRWQQAWVWVILLGAVLTALGVSISRFVIEQTDFLARHAQAHPEGWEATNFLLENAFGVTPLDSPVWLWIYVPHSGSISETIAGLGTSFLVIGLSIIVCRLAPVRVVTWPLRALGRIPLSAYVAHILGLGYLNGIGRDISEPVFATINLVAPIIFAVVWLYFFKRGPLEQLLTWATSPLSRLVTRVG